MKPVLSVVMAASNEEPVMLGKAVQSVLKQSFKDFELIIILDNPANSAALKLLRETAAKDRRVHLLINKQKIRLAASLNRGISLARGKYLARMDADDICLPKRFEVQVKYLDSHPDVDFLFAWTRIINEHDKVTSVFHPDRRKALSLQKHLFERHLLVHPTVLGRAAAFKRLRYDGTFWSTEDFELWMRAVGKYGFDIVEQELLLYRVLSQTYPVRLRKIREYTTYAWKACTKNGRLFLGDIKFWGFAVRTAMLRCLSALPAAVVIPAMRLKDRMRR